MEGEGEQDYLVLGVVVWVSRDVFGKLDPFIPDEIFSCVNFKWDNILNL